MKEIIIESKTHGIHTVLIDEEDWDKVKHWNTEDWEKDRENMLPRLQAMRVRLFNKAVKKGQLQTAAQILDSLGKVIGESIETVNIQAPELSIRVENK